VPPFPSALVPGQSTPQPMSAAAPPGGGRGHTGAWGFPGEGGYGATTPAKGREYEESSAVASRTTSGLLLMMPSTP
jgi:hypothetical protein